MGTEQAATAKHERRRHLSQASSGAPLPRRNDTGDGATAATRVLTMDYVIAIKPQVITGLRLAGRCR
jgi:hypothetical protein